MRNGPSQLLENLPPSFRALLRIRHTKSPLWNSLGLTLELYRLAARILHASSLVPKFVDEIEVDQEAFLV